MAKDLVNSAADGLLKETLAILKGKGSDADKVANALDHLSLGLQARKLAAKRMATKAETKVVTAAAEPAVNQTVTPAPKVDPVVAALANGKTDTKAGWLGK